jgi:23S rRNA (adenine2503-C2)-methyltransferase
MTDEIWKTVTRIDDEAERVAKFVFSNASAVAEAVLYRYPTYQERTVICCSTQSGCPVGCRFCGAGDSFVRSLTTDEIVSQPTHLIGMTGCAADEIARLQIMFMSMGEPLLNMKALVPAMLRLYSAYPKAALLISTSAPRVNYDEVIEISRRIPTIGLQFSVHESTDAARNALIPFKAKLSLAEIVAVGGRWQAATGRKPFFNYCAHDANSTDDDADRVAALFDPRIFEATVSVVCERNEGLPATNDHQRSLAMSFAERLLLRGFNVRVFDPAGQDTIGGGCGQLWFVQQWMADHEHLVLPSIGRGRAEVHTPVLPPERISND